MRQRVTRTRSRSSKARWRDSACSELRRAATSARSFAFSATKSIGTSSSSFIVSFFFRICNYFICFLFLEDWCLRTLFFSISRSFVLWFFLKNRDLKSTITMVAFGLHSLLLLLAVVALSAAFTTPPPDVGRAREIDHCFLRFGNGQWPGAHVRSDSYHEWTRASDFPQL